MNPKKSLLPVLSVFIMSCAGTPEEYSEDEYLENVAYYAVEKGNILPAEFEEEQYMNVSDLNQQFHKIIWDRTLDIIPDEYEKFIKYFRISSDGIENIMAYVEPSEIDEYTDLSSWTLAVDIIDVLDHKGKLNKKEMDETLIHEFAHILSLNSEQMNPVPTDEIDDYSWMETWDFTECYRSYDSISLKDSYLNQFFQEFWGEDQMREWMAVETENETEEDYFAAFNRLTIKYHTDFVSDYALTNPEEDFAESFTHFVTGDKQDGNLISLKKINFFYAFPELVKMRDEIRAVLPAEYKEL